MLTGIHVLLTYTCLFECDHCFLYCSPNAEGTFTLDQLRKTFDEIVTIPTIEWVYFEGGESFLYYPLLLEGIRMTRDAGLKAGIVTNAYWATTVEDAELWLRPLCELGVSDLSVSDDQFHSDDERNSPAKKALEAAERLGMPVGSICIEGPVVEEAAGEETEKGAPVIGGDVKFRGRAVDKLGEGLPRRRPEEFTECPYEDFEDPKRVHIDPFGHVHLCQGLIIGNMWEEPLSSILENYRSREHPICGPLRDGGPYRLAEKYGIKGEEGFIDACHFCYITRLALIERYPECLAPKLVYGLE
jgi:MoaA/NifB/PqqE/SkfB family radical SAM enzyme